MNEPKVSDDKVLIANLVTLFFCNCIHTSLASVYKRTHATSEPNAPADAVCTRWTGLTMQTIGKRRMALRSKQSHKTPTVPTPQGREKPYSAVYIPPVSSDLVPTSWRVELQDSLKTTESKNYGVLLPVRRNAREGQSQDVNVPPVPVELRRRRKPAQKD